MKELEFQAKYIAPFYGDLMNLNFLRKSENETLLLFDNIEKLAKELKNVTLIELLNNSWRPSKVGAWMICLSNRDDLKPELVKYLSREAIHYSEHVLLCLLIMEEKNAANAIVKFIECQTKSYLKKENFIDIEILSIDWGISILKYLDNEYNANYIQEIYETNWWREFENKIKELRFYDALKAKFKPEYHLKSIELLMERIKKRR